MNTLLNNFFLELHNKNTQTSVNDFILWPNTPLDNSMQNWIKTRYGIEDNIEIPGSRPYIISKAIQNLINHSSIPSNFSIIDICCGDALILLQLKKQYLLSTSYGFDLNVGAFETHQDASSAGVQMIKGTLQHLVKNPLPQKIDIIVMLNTLRSWYSAKLRENEFDLPSTTNEWILKNCKYAFLTVNQDQLIFFKNRSNVTILHAGEENSQFILIQI